MISEREARRVIAAANKARKLARPKRPQRVAHVNVKARVHDFGFLMWLHDGIPCVACLIEGEPAFILGELPRTAFRIEVAHQKHVAGKGGMLGKRPDDADTCPLCAWHHRYAPNACDPAQRKFWDRLGVDVGAFCQALFAAYQSGQDGAEVVRRFAGEGK